MGRVGQTDGGPGDVAGSAMKQVKSLVGIGKTHNYSRAGAEAVSEQTREPSLHHQLNPILERIIRSKAECGHPSHSQHPTQASRATLQIQCHSDGGPDSQLWNQLT